MRQPRTLCNAVLAAAAFGLLAVAAPPQSAIDYSAPGTLVSVGHGRTLNLLCAGKGSPTVVLIPGLGDSTIVWRLVQPQVALRTHVCAWDRAGFGFSGPSPANQSAAERARDLERTLAGAHVQGPLILVAHSLGAYEALVFADRNRGRLAGMVLVDPAVPDQENRIAKPAPDFQALDVANFAVAVAASKRCEAAVRAGTIHPGDPDPDGCFQYPDYYPAALKEKLARLDTNPDRVHTQISLYDNDATTADGRSRTVLNPRRTYGALPLIVLSAGDPFTRRGASAAVAAQAPLAQAAWWQAHIDLAKLSRRGEHRVVAHTKHTIQLTQPDAVAQAIDEVLDAARQHPHRHSAPRA